MANVARFSHSVCSTCKKIIWTPARWSSNIPVLKVPQRKRFARMYPTTLMYPDGSTITIRYKEPRHIIKLPFDIDTLSSEEREEWIKKRNPVKKMVYKDDFEDDGFSHSKYEHLWKKKLQS